MSWFPTEVLVGATGIRRSYDNTPDTVVKDLTAIVAVVLVAAAVVAVAFDGKAAASALAVNHDNLLALTGKLVGLLFLAPSSSHFPERVWIDATCWIQQACFGLPRR